ncbi:hypothetical protein QOM21_01550 [Streptomyces sp. Pv4-95]|uniref:hypothetical protein n=1 Tax=Streptomyces sp. Pv4-95 TaxID=3049543 RepID=UPI0038915340
MTCISAQTAHVSVGRLSLTVHDQRGNLRRDASRPEHGFLRPKAGCTRPTTKPEGCGQATVTVRQSQPVNSSTGAAKDARAANWTKTQTNMIHRQIHWRSWRISDIHLLGVAAPGNVA